MRAGFLLVVAAVVSLGTLEVAIRALDLFGEARRSVLVREDAQVPGVLEEDTALNAKTLDCKDEFRVPEIEEKPKPTPEQIAANKQKWGLAGDSDAGAMSR